MRRALPGPRAMESSRAGTARRFCSSRLVGERDQRPTPIAICCRSPFALSHLRHHPYNHRDMSEVSPPDGSANQSSNDAAPPKGALLSIFLIVATDLMG